jgi:hypothetical protein
LDALSKGMVRMESGGKLQLTSRAANASLTFRHPS